MKTSKLILILIITLITNSLSAQIFTLEIYCTDLPPSADSIMTAQADSAAIPEADTVIMAADGNTDTIPSAENPADQKGEYSITAHYEKVEGGYNFWTAVPTRDTAQKLPLILHLHGASLCGRDLNRARRYGPVDALRYGRQIKAVILNPQCPGGGWNPQRLNKIVDWTIANYNIDTTRIYVLGMSMGGYGTMDYCTTYPERVAAGMALCGGITKDPAGLSKLPFWIMHGTADRSVGISCSKEVVQKLQDNQQDSLLMFTWLEKASHSALARIFYMPKTYEWLFSHTLGNRSINRNCEYTMDDIKNAYTGISKYINTLKITNKNPNPSKYNSWDDGLDYTNAEVYVIKSGDVLVNISKKTKVPVDEICRLNNITRTTTLRVGQKLILRKKK